MCLLVYDVLRQVVCETDSEPDVLPVNSLYISSYVRIAFCKYDGLWFRRLGGFSGKKDIVSRNVCVC